MQKLIDKYQYPNVTSQILDEHVEMSPKEVWMFDSRKYLCLLFFCFQIDKTKSHQNELDALAAQNSNLKSHPTSDPKSKSNNSDGLSNSKNENEDVNVLYLSTLHNVMSVFNNGNYYLISYRNRVITN